MKFIHNYIGGDLVAPATGKYIDCFNPALGSVYAQIPDSDKSDVETAISAAEAAFVDWSNLPLPERSRYMIKVAEGIEARHEALALAESIDNGKPLVLARSVDIPRGAANFRFYGTALLHFASESHEMAAQAINYTLRQPLGVVGCISPWNLPLYLFTWKIAPALAAGNTVVAKPSEITPMTAYLLSEICMEAGLPPGVLNIVHGHGNTAGEAIVTSPAVKAVSFTGGTMTGRRIAKIASPLFKKLSLELGGKNPNIIFADCAYDEMLHTTIKSSFSNQGEICLCGSRIFVEASIYDRFKKDFVEKTRNLVVGDPLQESTDQGAIVSEQHLQKILSYISLAREEGGKILSGGHRVKLPGENK
jgi:aminomuconate-semialdehyde/2-hydroxymuconate-6-semialdehyde dehydrogenase